MCTGEGYYFFCRCFLYAEIAWRIAYDNQEVSGAVYNPAVSVGLWLSRRSTTPHSQTLRREGDIDCVSEVPVGHILIIDVLPLKKALGYVAVQIVGGFLGALMAYQYAQTVSVRYVSSVVHVSTRRTDH